MSESNNQVRPLTTCAVTGGAGFLGRNIAKMLLEKGCQVKVLDRVAVDFEHANLSSEIADITDTAAMEKAFEGIDCVFHTAAVIDLLGGSAVTDEYRQRSLDINFKGTQGIIDACIKAGVTRLVYTSSNVVCYNGTPNVAMTSDTPYATRIYDMYTESKILAEKAVMEANGKNGLLTCGIRPAGIYGPESNIMLDKFCQEVASGKLVVTIGDPNAVHDNSFVHNLAHAEILAGERLVDGNRCCGRSYFISDNDLQNYFEFFRPLIEGLGYEFPKFNIPMWVLLPFIKAWQWLHFKVSFPAPIMGPKELDKVCVTHFGDFRESGKDLDYTPLYTVKEAMEICLPYCQELHDKLKAS